MTQLLGERGEAKKGNLKQQLPEKAAAKRGFACESGEFSRLPFLLFNSQPTQVNSLRFELGEAIIRLYSWRSPHFEYFRVNCLFFLKP